MRMRALAVAVLGGLLATGCFVSVTHVSNPAAAFDEARAEAARYAGRPGPARSLQVLVYDPGDRELVRVSLPMWIVRKLEHEAADWDDEAWDDEGGDKVRHALHGRLSLRDLEKAALGTLIEVEEEDGEQVLVWLK
jgi:hypothetical protein